MNRSILGSSLVLVLAVSLPLGAKAQVVNNPTQGIFLASYTGGTVAAQPDLDVKSTQVIYDGTSLIFNATLAGNIGLTPNAAYVFGLDRGAGTARFSGIGVNNVLFDSVVIVRPDGSIAVNPITGGTAATNYAAGTATINGASFSAKINASNLPSQGFAYPSQYTFNLWPRLLSGGGTQPIPEFVPNASGTSTPSGNAAVTAAPEATTLPLLALGLLIAVPALRRRNA